VRARAPASAANLGPGLDVLAVALDLYVEVEVEPAERLQVWSEGEGSELPADASHLAAKVATDVCGHDRLAIRVRSEIPVARGLGSSAAIAVAAAAAAGAEDPLGVAARVEGHPDNAAAAFAGGLVAVNGLDGADRVDGADGVDGVDGSWRVSRLPLDTGLVFVALVPDRPLETARARAALPLEVPRADAVFNLGRLALLLEGLGDVRKLVPDATQDRLHQPPRTPLFPEAPQLLAALDAGGARAACWSGAGPTLLALCESRDAPTVAGAGRGALAEAGVAGRVLVLHADVEGVVVGDRARLPSRSHRPDGGW
jgi:homoserine kinase